MSEGEELPRIPYARSSQGTITPAAGPRRPPPGSPPAAARPFRRRRGFHLARALLYLPADALQRRRDALRQRVATLGRLLLHLRPRRALAEGEVHHHLACALPAVCHREPPRVVAPGLRAPLHPALPLVHGKVALGLEGAPVPARVLERRPDRWPGTPSAEGPTTEESTTGGRYSGRLPTSDSQAKTSSGGASIAWLCSYSWGTVRSLRRLTNAPSCYPGHARLRCDPIYQNGGQKTYPLDEVGNVPSPEAYARS
jgi:hypothetical protein